MIIETIKTKANLDPSKTKDTEEKPVSKCPFLQFEASVKLTNFTSGKRTNDTLHNQSVPIKCTQASCMGALMSGQSTITECKTKEELIAEAEKFQEQYYASLKKKATTEDFLLRMQTIKEQISKTGTYDLTYEELSFGSKLAWRNASRCIGRIQWNRLEVFDCRNISTTEEMYHAMCAHLEYATNKGNLRSAITLFPARVEGREDFRVWNPQLINFAGYLQPDGSIIGDPGRLNFTRICQRLGWKGKGGKFDILPWVFSAPGEGVKWYDVPEELILMVKLEHPKYDWFAELGISWYAVPAVADMMLDIGGLNFTAAPFNGWYMATEIGARNLCDVQRYNIAQQVAEKLGLDTMTPTSLWKDTALVETTLAVLYSFQKNKVTIVDHHTAAETFMKHMETEQKLRGGCPADWVWIVPPISGCATPVFHQEMIIYNLKPSFEYQEKAWLTHKWPRNKDIHLKYKFRSVARVIQLCVAMMSKVSHHRIMASILYATETGKSETFARKLSTVLNASFNTRVCCMEDYDPSDIECERFVVFVTSTFGSGEPPDNGKAFWKSMKKLKEKGTHLFNLKFTVFALGSSQYPNFCQFGKNLDTLFTQMGAKRIMPVEMGDELGGQEHVFNNWLPKAFKSSCIDFDIPINDDFVIPGLNCSVWKSGHFRFTITRNPEGDTLEELSKLHHKKLFGAKMLTKMNLQAKSSKRKTLFIRLDVSDPSVLSYEPGDHIAIFPTNPPALVEAILKHVDLPEHDKNKVIQTEYCQSEVWKKFERLPEASLRTLLSHYLDITTPPTSSFLFLLSRMATHKWDQFRLKRLSEVTDDYEDWKNFRYPNLAEALEMFPSVELDPTLLISELPLLQPRYYSISSSRLSSPNEVHITCTLVSFRTQEGKGPVHHGVCTSYLNSIPSGEIPCYIRHAPRFRLPEDQSESIIMVGAGSGIAPFRSFWCERDAVIKKQAENGGPSRSFGDMFLFFGCRQSKVDNLYAEELSSLQRKGVITRVFNAYSREPGQEKQYVQHRLEVESSVVLNVLENGGHIYVCGDAIMAEDVRNTVNKILMNSKKIRNIDDLLESGKYHEDVFGVLHKK